MTYQLPKPEVLKQLCEQEGSCQSINCTYCFGSINVQGFIERRDSYY